MRMASILEGIYITHDVNFEFVRVLANLLEEEVVLREAYLEEINKSISKFVKNLETTIQLRPVIKEYFESEQRNKNRKNSTNFSNSPKYYRSSILVASSIIFPYHDLAPSYTGFVISGAIIIYFCL